MEKWLWIRVWFSQILDSVYRSESKSQNPAGVDSGTPDPVPPLLGLWQRWPESLFQTPTPLLFQNFCIRVRQFFKFENATPVQTPATVIDQIVIYPCFYLRNDHTDSYYCWNWKVTQIPITVEIENRFLLLLKLKTGSGVKRNFWPVIVFHLFCFSE